MAAEVWKREGEVAERVWLEMEPIAPSRENIEGPDRRKIPIYRHDNSFHGQVRRGTCHRHRRQNAQERATATSLRRSPVKRPRYFQDVVNVEL